MTFTVTYITDLGTMTKYTKQSWEMASWIADKAAAMGWTCLMAEE